MEAAVKHKTRATFPTFVRDAKVHDKVDRLRGVRKESRQLDVSTPLTPGAGNLGCRYLGGCAVEVRELGDRQVMRLLSAGANRASAHMVTECIKIEFLAPGSRKGKRQLRVSVHPRQRGQKETAVPGVIPAVRSD